MRKYIERFLAYRAGLVAGGIVLLLVVAAIVAELVPGVDPHAISVRAMLPPSLDHPLGTDELGRDVLVSLVFGIKVSLTVGLSAALAATLFGVVIGAMAGFYGGWFDLLSMRISEIFQVMPTFVMAAVIVALSGPGISRVVAVIALLAWPKVARLMRAEVMRVKQLEFVDAVRCLGVSEWKILATEIIPNALAPVLAGGTLIVAQAILLEAALSFFGLSSADMISWGRILNSGQRFLYNAWWLSFFPGLAILITVLAFNLLGDALGSALNPKARR